MEKVKGIGGVFLKAKNPEMMAVWYETHLGISFEGDFEVARNHAGE
jgi:glyoxylase I family protein